MPRAIELDVPYSVCCATCGSTKIVRDATAIWNIELQLWELSDLYEPSCFCKACDREVRLAAQPLPSASVPTNAAVSFSPPAPPSGYVPAIQAARILEALAALYVDGPMDPAQLLTHALGDLRHLADQHDLSFALHDRNAYQVYIAERQS